MVDVRVRQQDGAHIARVVTQLAQRGEHALAVPWIAGVDEHDAGVVGDQRPVDGLPLSKVHGVGDLNKCWRRGLVAHARESRDRHEE